MAVEEVRHLNLFSPQFITNRNLNEANGCIYNNQIGSGVAYAGTVPESLLPASYPPSVVPGKACIKADSGVTYNVPVPPRKRYIDSMNQNISTYTVPDLQPNNNMPGQLLSFVGQEIPLQMHQHQLEIDHIVAQHTKKMRFEVEERQKQHARRLVSAMGHGMGKKLKEKDEQIQRMAKINWVLQERVKALYTENQLWRDLAQTNQATANSLRTNLEQLLAHVSHDHPSPAAGDGVGAAEDAESCCDSSDCGKEDEAEADGCMLAGEGLGAESRYGMKRMCKGCGERESSVLLLPCRHLCLCAGCGSTLVRNCPVCNTFMEATLHVNMS
ncbi:BOI-related E3 ubiquitin-protein ligase 1-like [Actinidia eriantha]|uniref:BOI-related E3 ubiquitin-protein ligase 1-like n=1 Tax=Actinidia eriantha TaxID=165200 RepID=UPI00258EA919|nr:BOI-related E3 ubiquitin-protein ligase 1-like [Actinidia eriantha]